MYIIKISIFFVICRMKVGTGPISLMYFDLSPFYPPFQILKEKLEFYHHVMVGLKPNALAHQSIQTQHRLRLKACIQKYNNSELDTI